MDLLPLLEPSPLDPVSRRPLLAMTDLAGIPWVGFADEPAGPVAVALPADADRDEAEAEAIARLARRAARWDVLRTRGVTGVPSMLAFEGDPFAAERILDASFLVEAEVRLGTQPIALAIPRRGVLLARSGTVDGDWDEWEAFVTWVDHLHRGGGAERLSPLVFSAVQGEVTGLILRSDSTETTWLREPVGLEPEDPWVSRVMVFDEGTGRTAMHVLVGATGAAELRRAVAGAFHRFLPQALADEEFGGELRFVALSEFLPDTPEVREAVADLQAQLNRTIAVSSRAWPVAVRVIVQYGG